MSGMKIYTDEELLCTNNAKGGDKEYNLISVKLAMRCSCGGELEVDNNDDNVFYADTGIIVIPHACKKCGNFGQTQIDVNF